ncbi:TPA: hypothetical protein ACX96U_001187 [Clostridium sporogenes]
MKYNEFINQIANSKPNQWMYDDEIGKYVFINNISITMKQDRQGNEEFFEEWVKNFIHHPTATKMKIYLCFNGDIIDTFYTASVDEARMYIPYPKSSKELTITNKQYNIGRIVNIPKCNVIDNYDEYLREAGIKVLESEEAKLDFAH